MTDLLMATMKTNITANIMIALLRSCFSGGQLDEEILGSITPEILSRVCVLSAHHDLVHLIAVALDKHALLPNDKLGQSLRKQQFMAAWRYEKQYFEYQRICDTFERDEIDHVPLKGAVIRAYYPEPWMRTSCDIDILVREADLDRAVQVLMKQLNYRKKADNHHDISLISESGVNLELHFTLKENMERMDAELSKVWDYSRLVSPGLHQYYMTNEFLMFYILAHMAYHFLRGGCGVRTVLDFWLLRRHIKYDEREVRELCSNAGLLKFYHSILKLTNVWFENGREDELIYEMQEYILNNGTYGTKEAGTAVARTAAGGKTRYWGRRIFLSREILQTSYPTLKHCPVLYPYYLVRRWCKIFKGEYARRAVSELRVNQNLTEETLARISVLLKQLDLL